MRVPCSCHRKEAIFFCGLINQFQKALHRVKAIKTIFKGKITHRQLVSFCALKSFVYQLNGISNASIKAVIKCLITNSSPKYATNSSINESTT